MEDQSMQEFLHKVDLKQNEYHVNQTLQLFSSSLVICVGKCYHLCPNFSPSPEILEVYTNFLNLSEIDFSIFQL